MKDADTLKIHFDKFHDIVDEAVRQHQFSDVTICYNADKNEFYLSDNRYAGYHLKQDYDFAIDVNTCEDWVDIVVEKEFSVGAELIEYIKKVHDIELILVNLDPEMC